MENEDKILVKMEKFHERILSEGPDFNITFYPPKEIYEAPVQVNADNIRYWIGFWESFSSTSRKAALLACNYAYQQMKKV